MLLNVIKHFYYTFVLYFTTDTYLKMNKLEAFEYVLFKLTNWYSVNTGSNQNDLSVLKVLKLLFFISAVDTTKDSENTLLDNVFSNFVAMPYGHVESDIYHAIKNQSFQNISISNSHSEILETFDVNTINPELKSKVDISIDKLQSINPHLIEYSSFDLVDLSHSWYSWQYYFNLAKNMGVHSIEIPTEAIKEEEKIYKL